MLIKVVLLFITFGFSALLAQDNKSSYPMPIQPGSTIKLPDGKNVFWIVKHNQYKKMIKIARKQEIDSLRIDVLTNQLALYHQIQAEKDSLVMFYKDGYIHYRDYWEKTNKELEEAEVKAAKRLAYLQSSIAIGTLTAILIYVLK